MRLIKLDVEGYEHQAVLGAEKLIRRDQRWMILEYIQNRERNDYPLVSLLEGWGYTCLDIRTLKPVAETAEIDMTDIAAIPKKEMGKFVEMLTLF